MSRNSERMVAELVELGYNPAERLLGPDRHTGGGRLPGAVAARGRVQPLYGDSDRSSPAGRRRSRLRTPEILAGILPETDRVPTAGGELAQGPGLFPPAILGERRGGATVTTARYRLNGAPDHRPSTTRWPQPFVRDLRKRFPGEPIPRWLAGFYARRHMTCTKWLHQ